MKKSYLLLFAFVLVISSCSHDSLLKDEERWVPEKMIDPIEEVDLEDGIAFNFNSNGKFELINKRFKILAIELIEKKFEYVNQFSKVKTSVKLEFMKHKSTNTGYGKLSHFYEIAVVARVEKDGKPYQDYFERKTESVVLSKTESDELQIYGKMPQKLYDAVEFTIVEFVVDINAFYDRVFLSNQ